MYNKNKTSFIKHLDFLLIDIISLCLSFYIAFSIRNNGVNLFNQYTYIRLLAILVIFNILIGVIYEPYKDVLKKDYLKELKTSFLFVLFNLMIVTLYLFLFKIGAEYSRLIISYTYLIYFFVSYICKQAWKNILKKKSLSSINNTKNKSLLVLCNKDQLEQVITDIENNNYQFFYICGICVVDKKMKNKTYKKNNIVANIGDVLNYVSTNWVDDIFIACDYNDIPSDVMNGFMATGISIHLKHDTQSMFEGRTQYYDKLANYNVITAVNREYDNWQLILKKVIDILGGIVGSLITVILIIIIGPIIYIKSPGNIFYVSDRVGKNGKIFKFYKFRSMVLNADDLKDDLRKKNRIKDQTMFKIKDDPRIIPGIGNFIRKTSLDEFPQFFNVLKGDMSLVGTRPPTMDEWKKYTPYYRSRMSIKPGITGLWQVSGRSEITDFDEVVKLDNEYINNWSIGNDIRILFKTVIQLFIKNDGAM